MITIMHYGWQDSPRILSLCMDLNVKAVLKRTTLKSQSHTPTMIKMTDGIFRAAKVHDANVRCW
jgi:hypothetical protein